MHRTIKVRLESDPVIVHMREAIAPFGNDVIRLNRLSGHRQYFFESDSE